jgi:N-acylneuraminate cytidylyltransferase
VDDVYVTSDSEEILAVAEQYGAQGIKRPEALANGTASSESALIHAVEWMDLAGQERPDVIVFLQCTSPFTSSDDIDRVHAALQGDVQAAFSVVEDHGFIWVEDEAGYAAGVTHDHRLPRQRRQDMKARYRETGAIYAMKTEAFLKTGTRFCGPSRLVVCPAPPFEIDTEDDWKLAEAVASNYGPDSLGNNSARKPIRALVTDFDGVHTDDLMIQFVDGSEGVTCSRSDGMGIEMLRERGLALLILSKEQNKVVTARARKLKMEVQHHILNKLAALDQWRIEKLLDWSEICYVGNDINDLECMRRCGLSAAPQDAHPLAKSAATLHLSKPGGRGALRELSEILISDGLIAKQ